jgi:hypothetical protein
MRKRTVMWMVWALLISSAVTRAQNSSPPQQLQQRTPGAPAQAPAGPQGKLVGNWQGTLQLPGGKSLRTIVRITQDDGKYRGQFYSIDQNGQPMALSSAALRARR